VVKTPWMKPFLVQSWPSDDETFCGEYTNHRAHSWAKLKNPVTIRWGEELESNQTIETESFYCKGYGIMRGYL
jgi:hypothetical protein